jgi:GT2 family glycosyltransferase
MRSSKTVSVVIVTHNSEKVISRCVDALTDQTRRADKIVIVDSCSVSQRYLDEIERGVTLIRSNSNVGFCRGNNIGVRACADSDYILFLNPDAFLSPTFIADAVNWIERPENSGVGILTGTLLGFDIDSGRPSNRVDSTGLFQNWYGRWYDRDQGNILNDSLPRSQIEELPAACGALMFCRNSALADVLLRGEEVFDESFFMYKEDIDLSLRIAQRGWRVSYVPGLISWHGRGWGDRRNVAPWAKKISARNELRVCWRNRGKGLLFTLAKYVFVHMIEPVFERDRSS